MVSIKFKELFSFKKKEISSAFEKIRGRFTTPGLKLLIGEIQEPLPFGKLLIITPGKSGNAVQRNLIKRRIKAIFFEEELFKIPRNSIILVNNLAVKLTYEEIKIFLVAHLK